MRSLAPIRRRFLGLAPCLALAIVALPVAAQETPDAPEAMEEPTAGPDWVSDVAAAKARAAKEGKDLLINFTGSDWCVWCKRLDGEVFSKATFLEGDQADKFVFLYLDFPRDPELLAEVVDPELNEKLRETYAVQGFPTIILADASGHPYARTGYQAGGPENYNSHLSELRTKGAQVKALLTNEDEEKSGELLQAAFPVLLDQDLLEFPEYKEHLEAAGKIEALAKQVETYQAKKDLASMLQTPEPDWPTIHTFIVEHKSLEGPEFLNACWFCVTMYLEGEKKFEDGIALLRRMLADPIVAGDERGQGMINDKIKQFEKAVGGSAGAGHDDSGDGGDHEGHDHDG